ncbi:hypothetical protein H6F89_20235 [Cyanobacteria bacterium FACHB-63]|nr:hypothetical protein [Cyanobacteria bacterium FACHB-63]
MPRPPKKTTDATPKYTSKERVRFIFEPDRNSPNGQTYSWLIHTTYDGKEKAASATRSFWMPFAARDSGKYSEAELQELAKQCIWRLEEQIQFIRENFGVDVPARQVIASPPATSSTAENGAGSSTSEPQTEQERFFNDLDLSMDDNMLGDIGDALS